MNNSVFVRSQENRQKKPPKEELRLLLRAERKNSPDFRGNFVKSLKKNYDSLMLGNRLDTDKKMCILLASAGLASRCDHCQWHIPTELMPGFFYFRLWLDKDAKTNYRMVQQ